MGRGKLRSYGTPRVVKKAVSTAPGATVDTVMPSSSSRSRVANVSSPALVTE